MYSDYRACMNYDQVHACTTIIVLVSCPTKLLFGELQVAGHGGEALWESRGICVGGMMEEVGTVNGF